jgi:hypothetical protein
MVPPSQLGLKLRSLTHIGLLSRTTLCSNDIDKESKSVVLEVQDILEVVNQRNESIEIVEQEIQVLVYLRRLGQRRLPVVSYDCRQ